MYQLNLHQLKHLHTVFPQRLSWGTGLVGNGWGWGLGSMCHFRGMASFCLLWAHHYLSFCLVYDNTVSSDLNHAHSNFPDRLRWGGISHYQSTIHEEITFILEGIGWLYIKQKDLNQFSGAQETRVTKWLCYLTGRVRAQVRNQCRVPIRTDQWTARPKFLSLTAGSWTRCILYCVIFKMHPQSLPHTLLVPASTTPAKK